MANCIVLPRCIIAKGVMELPVERGRWKPQYLTCMSKQLLATDPIGIATVTFFGVVASSEIRVYYPDQTEAAGIESCAANQVLTWSIYQSDVTNTVIIRIIHPDYKIKEFTYLSSSGNTTLPVQQERDKWYSNPV
jgi:hypothetical protein